MKNLFRDLEKYSDNSAIFLEQETISYKKLLSIADKIACQIGHRSLVVVACKNSYASLAGYVGFMRAGIVPLLISSTINNDLLSKLVECYQPDYLYLPSELAISFQNCESVFKHEDYELKKAYFESRCCLHDDLALLLSTSGSTGSPKYVRQSYNNIASNTNSIAKFLKITEVDRAITTMPMNYTYGLSIINTHLFKGASIILTEDSIVNQRFWKTLKEKKATTFGGVPYIYEILKKLRFERMKLPSIRYITQAGGKLSQNLSSEFAKISFQKDFKFFVMYGQVEATARISYLPPKLLNKKPGSIGIPIPGGKISLIDKNGKMIKKANSIGELIFQGKNVSLGYAENRFDLQKEDENQGLLYSGDLAIRDEDGFYYIVGRKKRFLKMYGNRINLDEVEQLIRSKGFDCACSGVDDCLKIYFIEPVKEEYIKKFISKQTGIHLTGIKMIVVEKIPRNETGKILYSELHCQQR